MSETPRDDGFADIARYDWVVTPAGNVLHDLAALDDPVKAEDDWGGPGRTGCGLWTEWVSIPGMFSRMGARRCVRCCYRRGFPQGVGSPKNDAALRSLLGLDDTAPNPSERSTEPQRGHR